MAKWHSTLQTVLDNSFQPDHEDDDPVRSMWFWFSSCQFHHYLKPSEFLYGSAPRLSSRLRAVPNVSTMNKEQKAWSERHDGMRFKARTARPGEFDDVAVYRMLLDAGFPRQVMRAMFLKVWPAHDSLLPQDRHLLLNEEDQRDLLNAFVHVWNCLHTTRCWKCQSPLPCHRHGYPKCWKYMMLLPMLDVAS